METGFPLVMLVGPLIAATVALIVRGRRRLTVAVGLIALALLTLLLSLASTGTGLFPDNVAALFGREVELTPFVRSLFLFIYPAMGTLFLFAWFRPMGRALVPAGLAVLTPLAATLMVSPLGPGALLLVVAAAVVVPLLHDGRFEAAGATWRYFLVVTVAAPALLLTATGQVGGEFALSWLAPLAATLMLLGGFPFHIWVDGLAHRAPASAIVIVLGLMQLVVVIFLLVLLDTAPAARATIEFQTAVRWSTVFTVLVAAFQMGRAMTWRGIVAGAILLDMGFLLPAALAPGAGGVVIALPALIARYMGLMLITVGLGRPPVTVTTASTRVERGAGILGRTMIIYGCLSLLGLPLTPGFAGRWAQLNMLGQGTNPLVVILVVTAMAVGAAVIWRGIWHRKVISEEPQPAASTASSGETALAALFLALSALLGLFPDILVDIVTRMLGLT